MNDFTTLIQQGNAWFFIPSAILLGALHGLEPGHSKTMMAAFIIAIKGTVKQAVMLGLAATVSHTAIVWLIAMGGMYVSQKFTAGAVEPWLQMISAVIIIGTAVWMFTRTWRGEKAWHQAQAVKAHPPAAPRKFTAMAKMEGASIPLVLQANSGDHHHQLIGLTPGSKEYQDAHALAHARDIERRFTRSEVSNMQILLFGLTGGLIPCPAAITILLICIQLKALTLGATLVVCFSVGLALTLVAVGVGAAISVQQASKRWPGFTTLAQKAPYLSSALIAIVGVYMAVHGYAGL
nr:nickel/cobalt efflux protein RcnA [uncultured Enterobacter sp.]